MFLSQGWRSREVRLGQSFGGWNMVGTKLMQVILKKQVRLLFWRWRKAQSYYQLSIQRAIRCSFKISCLTVWLLGEFCSLLMLCYCSDRLPDLEVFANLAETIMVSTISVLNKNYHYFMLGYPLCGWKVLLSSCVWSQTSGTAHNLLVIVTDGLQTLWQCSIWW